MVVPTSTTPALGDRKLSRVGALGGALDGAFFSSALGSSYAVQQSVQQPFHY